MIYRVECSGEIQHDQEHSFTVSNGVKNITLNFHKCGLRTMVNSVGWLKRFVNIMVGVITLKLFDGWFLN